MCLHQNFQKTQSSLIVLSRSTHYFSTTITPSPPHSNFQNYPPTLDGLRRRLAAESPTLADFIKLQSDQS
ncbi:Lipoyl synthase [Handroanthus impetiginosus]|uniref:Lipoyl synthase n=1 Tax=Handroanthus impetiginosus TaxID=429701 RepID=A0A2G9I5G3_9LAMI|nr:Lipoyl synthase [Handroanthus impetiginosus]